MNSKVCALGVAVAFMAIAAGPKDSTKKNLKATGGVRTPGVQVPYPSLKPEAEIALPGTATGIVFANELLVAAGKSIVRVDSKTNTPGKSIEGLGKACGGAIEYPPQTLWLADCGSKSLVKTDVKGGTVAAKTDVGELIASLALTAAAESIWVLGDAKTSLLRVDPKDNRIVADIRLPAECTSIHSAEASLWVTCPQKDKLLRIDPTTNLIDKWIDVAGGPYAVASGEGSIWIYTRKEGKIAQVDPKTNKVSATVDLGTPGAAATLAFGEGFLWVSAPGYPITKIQAATAKPVQQFVGEGGGGRIFYGLNSVWLAQNDKLLRFDPKRIAATLAD